MTWSQRVIHVIVDADNSMFGNETPSEIITDAKHYAIKESPSETKRKHETHQRFFMMNTP